MALPKALAKNPAATATIAILVLVLAIGFTVTRTGHVKHVGSNRAFYYDLDSGKLFDGPAGAVPVDVPGGGAGRGVLAHLYSCGSCAESDRQIGYLQTLSDEARALQNTKAATSKEMEQARMISEKGRLVARMPAAGQGPKWVMEMSPEGQKIMTGSLPACPQGAAKQCFPE